MSGHGGWNQYLRKQKWELQQKERRQERRMSKRWRNQVRPRAVRAARAKGRQAEATQEAGA